MEFQNTGKSRIRIKGVIDDGYDILDFGTTYPFVVWMMMMMKPLLSEHTFLPGFVGGDFLRCQGLD